jgi:hypothetical protein
LFPGRVFIRTMDSFDLENREMLVAIIYVCLLIDNILLTVIGNLVKITIKVVKQNNHVFAVPILPDYLATFSRNSTSMPNKIFDLRYGPSIIDKRISEEYEEGEYIGMLLAVKALVQLICNPVVGNLTYVLGYKILVFSGTCFLLMSSLCKFL